MLKSLTRSLPALSAIYLEEHLNLPASSWQTPHAVCTGNACSRTKIYLSIVDFYTCMLDSGCGYYCLQEQATLPTKTG